MRESATFEGDDGDDGEEDDAISRAMRLTGGCVEDIQADVREWANECLMVSGELYASGAELHASYRRWCPSVGLPAASERMFLLELGRRGLKRGVRAGVRVWLGVHPSQDWYADPRESRMGWNLAPHVPHVQAWLASRCVVGQGGVESAADLLEDYVRTTGQTTGSVVFGVILGTIPGLTSRRMLLASTAHKGGKRQAVVWHGVGLKPRPPVVVPPALVVPAPAAVPAVELYPDDI